MDVHQKLKEKCLSLGGDPSQGFGGFQRDDFFREQISAPLASALLEQGTLFDPQKVGIGKLKGKPRQCHLNSLMNWYLKPSQFTLFTGLAESGGIWRAHSWLIEKNGGRVMETTQFNSLYFGVPGDQDPEVAQMMNAKNSE